MGTIDTINLARTGFRRVPADTFARRMGRLVRSLFIWIDRLLEHRRSRLALLELTDDQLKDIGISRADAYREGTRPFWE
ncbi:DUF1127 domain-containing protein [Mesorhizobium sp. SP-1A]|uniref:DUF1127 domain-containing protein n=1 Tax=Mesorhizobium sp. SP-1A TaxID=3077840 RepID=UPI0028F74F88|nr:DUF1127 domain-containing protein [Mesorhizobium sp. SP-1A]